MLLSLYIADDERTKETFKKLDRKSKIKENILSIAWDLYHIRLIEQIMCSDNAGNKEQVILSYFATADTGLKDAMKINPLKAFVILDDYPIAFHSIRLKDVCQNKEIIDEVAMMAAKRKKSIEDTNFAEIKRKLLEEINKVIP